MHPLIDKVGKNFKIKRKIGEGVFGRVYQAVNTRTNLEVAVKIEPVNTDHPQLLFECKLYKYLHNDSTVIDKGIPNIYYYSTEGDYNFLVMDLLGPSLQYLFDQTDRKFSLKTVLMLIDQMISRIEYLHTKNFCHRNIKPENFCIGLNEAANKIFLIDFGDARRFNKKEPTCRAHLFRSKLAGKQSEFFPADTSQFLIDPTFKHDMESIGYVAMYFLRGGLPWYGIKVRPNQRKGQIQKKKLATTIEYLCKGYPFEFMKYFYQITSLKFNERPDYFAIRMMFKDLFLKNGYEYDGEYDWIIKEKGKDKQEKQQ